MGKELFGWEFAPAVAGAILEINAFNQPDVEASKIATRELTQEYERKGSLPAEQPFLEDHGIKLFSDERNVEKLMAKGGKSLAQVLRAHLEQCGKGDYFALLAYIQMSSGNEERLQAIRHVVRDSKRVATGLGFG